MGSMHGSSIIISVCDHAYLIFGILPSLFMSRSCDIQTAEKVTRCIILMFRQCWLLPIFHGCCTRIFLLGVVLLFLWLLFPHFSFGCSSFLFFSVLSPHFYLGCSSLIFSWVVSPHFYLGCSSFTFSWV